MLNEQILLGEYANGVKLADMTGLPVDFLDTDGMVLDRYADVPLYAFVHSPGELDGFGLEGLIGATPDDTTVRVDRLVKHSRAYAPVKAFRYVTDSVLLSFSDAEGTLINDIVEVESCDTETEVKGSLVHLTSVIPNTAIKLVVVRENGARKRVIMRFNND